MTTGPSCFSPTNACGYGSPLSRGRRLRVAAFAAPSNRLRHPAEDAVDQAGAPCATQLLRRRLVLGDAALIKIIQELDVVRLGDCKMLFADKHRVVVEERPDDRHRGRCGAVF